MSSALKAQRRRGAFGDAALEAIRTALSITI